MICGLEREHGLQCGRQVPQLRSAAASRQQVDARAASLAKESAGKAL